MAEKYRYPIVASHTGFRATSLSPAEVAQPQSWASERSKTKRQLERIRALGGLVGVGTSRGATQEFADLPACDGATPSFAGQLRYAISAMGGGGRTTRGCRRGRTATTGGRRAGVSGASGAFTSMNAHLSQSPSIGGFPADNDAHLRSHSVVRRIATTHAASRATRAHRFLVRELKQTRSIGTQTAAGRPVPQPFDRLRRRAGHRHDVLGRRDERQVE